MVYNEESLVGQERALNRLRRAVNSKSVDTSESSLDPTPYRHRFLEALEDDFNTPEALASLFDLAREINRGNEHHVHTGDGRESLSRLAAILGIDLLTNEPTANLSSDPLIDLLVQTRENLRSAKHYEMADQIRDNMKKLGIELEDTAQGTEWRRSSP
jgi:cysteinyl-tRNA synthetase